VAVTFHKKWPKEFDCEFKDANPLQCGDLKNNKSEGRKRGKNRRNSSDDPHSGG
jgi:hypothetical protein